MGISYSYSFMFDIGIRKQDQSLHKTDEIEIIIMGLICDDAASDLAEHGDRGPAYKKKVLSTSLRLALKI
jgi:hypothetical protein